MTWLRHFVWLAKLVWAFRSPSSEARLDAARRVVALLSTSAARAAEYAVDKIAADPSFHATKDHALKRAEALQWALAYAREHGLDVPAWDAAFLVEWYVGARKGRV